MLSQGPVAPYSFGCRGGTHLQSSTWLPVVLRTSTPVDLTMQIKWWLLQIGVVEQYIMYAQKGSFWMCHMLLCLAHLGGPLPSQPISVPWSRSPLKPSILCLEDPCS